MIEVRVVDDRVFVTDNCANFANDNVENCVLIASF